MSEYSDTILLECNRKSSPQYLAGNNENPAGWTNKLGSGIKLNIGDTISMKGAYVSAVGNESATIEINGRKATNNLNVGQTYSSSDTVRVKVMNTPNIGDITYRYTPKTITSQISDDKIKLTHSYYKTTNGEYYITLPRACSWNSRFSYGRGSEIYNQYNSSLNGSVVAPNLFRLDSDYSEVTYWGANDGRRTGTGADDAVKGYRNEIANNGEKYTLFTRKYFANSSLDGTYYLQGHLDPALFQYGWYKKTYSYDITNGFNSPLNVAASFTNQMSDVIKDQFDRYVTEEQTPFSDNDNYNIIPISRTNETFPTCFGSGFGFDGSETYFSGLDTVLPTDHSVSIYGDDDYTTTNVGRLVDPGDGGKAQFDATIIGQYVIDGVLAGLRIIDKINFIQEDVPFYCLIFDRSLDGKVITTTTLKLSFHTPDNIEEHLYEACYATIGYKRPEIQEAGRVFAEETGFRPITDTNPSHAVDGSLVLAKEAYYPLTDLQNPRSNCIQLNLEWTDENLLLMKKLFDAQGKYPELFKYNDLSDTQYNRTSPNVSVDTARFLHMNTEDNHTQTMVATVTGGSNVITVGNIASLKVGMVYQETVLDDELFPTDWTTIDGARTYVTGISGLTVTLSETAYSDAGSATIKFNDAKVGGDRYKELVGPNDFQAGALFFDYNPARSDMNTGDGNEGNEYESLRYGFGVKLEKSKGNPANGYQIGLYFGKANTMSTLWFEGGMISKSRSLGFDHHFCAFGTASIMLTNGLAGPYGSRFNASNASDNNFTSWQDRALQEGVGPHLTSIAWNKFQTDKLNNEILIGANDPALDFNSDQSRFEFTKLHTPEVVGTNASIVDAGSNIAGDDIVSYKINKLLSRMNYSPNFVPYIHNLISAANASDGKDHTILDKNIIPFTIMDATSGITLEDYGCDKNNWTKSLWNTLGFTYEQFHQTEDNRLIRFNNLAITTSTPTTNALIQVSDIRNWANINGVKVRESEKINLPRVLGLKFTFPNTSPSAPRGVPDDLTTVSIYGIQEFLTVVQSASSTTIQAEKLPKKMESPVYLIKTDLISPEYIGGPEGSSKLPIISVVSKNSGYGDYYFGSDETVFTITNPKTIQTITTHIVEASGATARVDDNSCVIYKVTKNQNMNNTVLQDILNPPPKNKM